jgi:hypothetical protein
MKKGWDYNLGHSYVRKEAIWELLAKSYKEAIGALMSKAGLILSLPYLKVLLVWGVKKNTTIPENSENVVCKVWIF